MNKPLMEHSLVLGGASSGKSVYAEARILAAGLNPVYIATAQVYDDEMRDKVVRHRAMRGDGWRTIEEPLDVAGAVSQATAGDAVLIDCATLWLTNVMLAQADIEAAEQALFAAMAAAPCPIVVVSNEVGLGIVPDNAMARRFRGIQGGFNQRLAAQVGSVVLVTAGLPMALKGVA